MNCRNGEPYLAEALASVRAQTYPAWELIFWDNASHDGSARQAQAFGPELRYFRSELPSSLGQARANAIGHARGELLALIDCDDIWHPDFLCNVVYAFQSVPQCGMAWADAYRMLAVGTTIGRFSDDRQFPRGDCFQQLFLDRALPPSSTTVMSLAALKEAGGYNPRYTICCDLDVFMRIASRRPVTFCAEPLGWYRMHATNDSRRVESLVAEEKEVLNYWRAQGPQTRPPAAALAFHDFRLEVKLGQFFLQQGAWGRAAMSIARAFARGLRRPSLAVHLSRIVRRLRSSRVWHTAIRENKS